MLSPPADLDASELVRALASWGLTAPRLDYLPVGFGSHHWRAKDGDGAVSFVTVDDLLATFRDADDADAAFSALERAYGAAAALRDEAGLEFVVAPTYNRDGGLMRRLGRRYSVSVAPFVEGAASAFGDYETADERRAVAVLVGRLHAAGAQIGVAAGVDDVGIPSRAALSDALSALDRRWTTGPFAEPTRTLLAARAAEVASRLREYDDLAATVRATSSSWVLTHGEPHRGNVIVDERGARYLVDWDTTLVAPRERDLQLVLDDELTGWDEYRSVAGDGVLDARAIDLYRRRWTLADIAGFVALIRRPHDDDENTAATFTHLSGYLAR